MVEHQRAKRDEQSLLAELLPQIEATRELNGVAGTKRMPARVYAFLNALGGFERPLLLTYHWIPAMRPIASRPSSRNTCARAVSPTTGASTASRRNAGRSAMTISSVIDGAEPKRSLRTLV